MASSRIAAASGHAVAAAALALVPKTLLFRAGLLRLLISIVQSVAASRDAAHTMSTAAGAAFLLLLVTLTVTVGLAFYATAQVEVQEQQLESLEPIHLPDAAAAAPDVSSFPLAMAAMAVVFAFFHASDSERAETGVVAAAVGIAVAAAAAVAATAASSATTAAALSLGVAVAAAAAIATAAAIAVAFWVAAARETLTSRLSCAEQVTSSPAVLSSLILARTPSVCGGLLLLLLAAAGVMQRSWRYSSCAMYPCRCLVALSNGALLVAAAPAAAACLRGAAVAAGLAAAAATASTASTVATAAAAAMDSTLSAATSAARRDQSDSCWRTGCCMQECYFCIKRWVETLPAAPRLAATADAAAAASGPRGTASERTAAISALTGGAAPTTADKAGTAAAAAWTARATAADLRLTAGEAGGPVAGSAALSYGREVPSDAAAVITADDAGARGMTAAAADTDAAADMASSNGSLGSKQCNVGVAAGSGTTVDLCVQRPRAGYGIGRGERNVITKTKAPLAYSLAAFPCVGPQVGAAAARAGQRTAALGRRSTTLRSAAAAASSNILPADAAAAAQALSSKLAITYLTVAAALGSWLRPWLLLLLPCRECYIVRQRQRIHGWGAPRRVLLRGSVSLLFLYSALVASIFSPAADVPSPLPAVVFSLAVASPVSARDLAAAPDAPLMSAAASTVSVAAGSAAAPAASPSCAASMVLPLTSCASRIGASCCLFAAAAAPASSTVAAADIGIPSCAPPGSLAGVFPAPAAPALLARRTAAEISAAAPGAGQLAPWRATQVLACSSRKGSLFSSFSLAAAPVLAPLSLQLGINRYFVSSNCRRNSGPVGQHLCLFVAAALVPVAAPTKRCGASNRHQYCSSRRSSLQSTVQHQLSLAFVYPLSRVVQQQQQQAEDLQHPHPLVWHFAEQHPQYFSSLQQQQQQHCHLRGVRQQQGRQPMSLWLTRVVLPIIPTPEALVPPRAPTLYEELLRRADVREVNYMTSLRTKAAYILPLLFDIYEQQQRPLTPSLTFKPQQFERLQQLYEAHKQRRRQQQQPSRQASVAVATATGARDGGIPEIHSDSRNNDKQKETLPANGLATRTGAAEGITDETADGGGAAASVAETAAAEARAPAGGEAGPWQEQGSTTEVYTGTAEEGRDDQQQEERPAAAPPFYHGGPSEAGDKLSEEACVARLLDKYATKRSRRLQDDTSSAGAAKVKAAVEASDMAGGVRGGRGKKGELSRTSAAAAAEVETETIPAAFHLIDHLYGPIYDKKVLLKQVHYFLEQGEWTGVRRILRENEGVLSKEDARSLLAHAGVLIESSAKQQLLQEVDAVWLAFRQALPFKLPATLRDLRLGPVPSSSGSSSDTGHGSSCSSHSSATDVSSSDKGECKSSGKERNSNRRGGRQEGRRAEQEQRRLAKEKEAAEKVRAALLRRLYEQSSTKVATLQQQAGLRVRALYHSLHKALWEHGALKPFERRTGKNQQKSRLCPADVSPYLKPPPDATRLDRLRATQAFRRAVLNEDLFMACKILRTQTRLLLFRTRPKLLAKFLRLYKVVHAKPVERALAASKKRHDSVQEQPAAALSEAAKREGREEEEQEDEEENDDEDEEDSNDAEGRPIAARSVQDNPHRSSSGNTKKRLTRKERNAKKRESRRPKPGGPYSERELRLLRKVWQTTLRKPRVILKIMEPVAEWSDQEAKTLYTKQIEDFRARVKRWEIRRWRAKGVDLIKYTHDFTNAKGIDWLQEMQAKGQLDASPPTLCEQPLQRRVAREDDEAKAALEQQT